MSFLVLLLLTACTQRQLTTPVPIPLSTPTITKLSITQSPIQPPVGHQPTQPTNPAPNATPTVNQSLIQPQVGHQPLNPTPTNLPTVTPTPNPYAALTIDALTSRTYGGGQIEILDILDHDVTSDKGIPFTRYLFSYPSDGLTIYGYINTPDEGYKFPVAILLHGYISPDEYETVDYTERYATSLVEAGYFVIHPNFRNYPPSDSGPDPFRIGYAIDILNLIAIIREQSQDPLGYLRRADADNIHLWGHSMGGGVALRVITVNTDPYIRAAVLYGSMSGNEQWNYEKIQEWSNGERGDFELAASPEMLDAISPINYLDRITAPISIHHSDADATVPLAWSEDLCGRLQAINHPVECFTYHAVPHTFNGPGDALFMERVINFFRRH
ncbi:MAG: alpha/beta fold hydrolase [Candidatus Promineifilaceae bacterium]